MWRRWVSLEFLGGNEDEEGGVKVLLLLEMEEEMEGRMVEELVEEMVVEMEGEWWSKAGQ